MSRLFVDTGIWVALLDAADPYHERARTVIKSNHSLSFVSTDLVLSETVTLVSRELGPERAAAFGQDFLKGKIGTLVGCETSDWTEAFSLLIKYPQQKLSLADAASMALIRRLGIKKAASFDKHFKIILVDREVIGLPHA